MKPGKLRVIGGTWRGRGLPVPAIEGLRPTPDRVRETLFNWLAPYIRGARCLDLFAGSGALGLEAASRGAGKIVMVERSFRAVEAIRKNLRTLGASGIDVIHGEALNWLRGPARKFDIVFLDPPFGKGLLHGVTDLLEQGGWLERSALIYLETESSSGPPPLPGAWEVARRGKAGQVSYYLATNRRSCETP